MKSFDLPRPVILIDDRQPKPHRWERFFHVRSVRGRLTVGHFSLPGCQNWIGVQAMTIDELVEALIYGRDSFLALLRKVRAPHFYLIVEGTRERLLKTPTRNHQNCWDSTVALEQRFGLPFHFAESPEVAARLCQSFLLQWLQEHRRALAAFDRAACKIEDGGGL